MDKHANYGVPASTGVRPYVFLWFLWQIIRQPVVFVLVLLEPLIRFAFIALALLGILMTIFFKLYGIPEEFPLFKMLAISVSFGLMPWVYGGLLRLVAK